MTTPSPDVPEEVLNLLSEGVTIVNRDGRIVFSNRIADLILGVRETDAAPDEWADHYGVFMPDRATPFPTEQYPLVRALAGEETNDVEMWIRNPGVPDGVMISVDGRPLRGTDGEIEGAAVVFRDVTELREIRSDLERIGDALRLRETVLEQSLVGIYVISDGVLRFVNEALARLFGVERSEALGRPLLDFVAEADRDRVAEEMRRGASGETMRLRGEFDGVKGDGEIIHLQVHGARIELDDRPAIAGVLIDVTERRELANKLLHAQRREALAELAGAVAHDFNNFLAAIMLSVEFALTLDPPEEVATELEEVKGTANSASELARKLLAYGRQQETEDRIIGLNEIVREMHPMLDKLTGAKIKVDTDLADSSLPVRVDKGHMEQVLMNLVVNARDAMLERGGRILIRSGRTDVRPEQARRTKDAPAGEYAILSVTDSGVGIAPEVLPRIFDPYFTTKKEGTGLGLATTHGIVKQHGGDISVESTPGVGTTFSVRIPLVRDREEDRAS